MADVKDSNVASQTHVESSRVAGEGQDTTRSSQLNAYEEKGTVSLSSDDEHDDLPTEDELLTLRRVRDHIPLKVFTVAFIELCERFSYYGTTVVCMFLSSSSQFTPTDRKKSRTSSSSLCPKVQPQALPGSMGKQEHWEWDNGLQPA